MEFLLPLHKLNSQKVLFTDKKKKKTITKQFIFLLFSVAEHSVAVHPKLFKRL